MILNEKKINTLFLYWLISSLILVFLIIMIGGLTRLTDSGLSITNWELFKGILPPLNDITWNTYFEKYKQIPQYKILNSDMSLDEFKVIFYWEYVHRILARLIGLFFLIPLIFFYLTKKINTEYMKSCYLIFFLIILQGIIGWYMVMCGLVNEVTVSHYRLSTHLITAFIIICSIFWLIKNVITNNFKFFFKFSKVNFPFQLLIILIFIQLILGAFVSGLDAGRIYQTWPLMGNNFLPDDLNFKDLNVMINFKNHSLVQFYHRNLAYFIVLYAFLLTIFIYRNKLSNLYFALKILLFFLFLQAILGIFTLISNLNILLASLHQITSVILVLSAINLYYLRSK